MKRLLYILISVVLALTFGEVYAQSKGKRYVTPVEKSTNRTLLPRKGEKLVYIERDSLVLDSLRRDSIAKIYPRYPKITALTVGFNFWDGVAQLFGQSYGSYDVMASVNMWNRLFPTIEVGVGRANSTPDGLNYTYKTPLSLYAKLGADYNFLFKKHPKYQFLVGVRAGYTAFKYDITDISVSDGYWDENTKLELTGMKSHAFYGEIVAGIRVNLYGPISAGWTLKYHHIFNYKKTGNIHPWYVPGFGSRESTLNVAFSVYYTLPMMKNSWPDIDEKGNLRNKPDPDAVTRRPADAIGNMQPGAVLRPVESLTTDSVGNSKVDIKADVKALNH